MTVYLTTEKMFAMNKIITNNNLIRQGVSPAKYHLDDVATPFLGMGGTTVRLMEEMMEKVASDAYSDSVYADMHGYDQLEFPEHSEDLIFSRLLEHLGGVYNIMAHGLPMTEFMRYYKWPTYWANLATPDLLEEVIWTFFKK